MGRWLPGTAGARFIRLLHVSDSIPIAHALYGPDGDPLHLAYLVAARVWL